jgi:hypothetical protein
MPRVSPTLEGFRAAFHRPSLTFAEIAWHWTVGAVAWAVFFFSVIEYLNSLPVSNADAALLWTRQPLLVGRAIAHILRGSLNRAALAVLLALIALSLLWAVAAAVGRIATVRALLDYFRRDVACNVSTEADRSAEPQPLRSLIGLNFLHVALALAALLAFVGASILVSFASPAAKPHPGLAFILFLPLAGLICIVCWALNWLLSLACLFAIRDGDDALSALSTAVTFSRERSGPLFAVSTWTGLAHLAAFSIATTAVSLPMAFIRVGPARPIIAIVILMTLAYFAVVDWLYMARLAGYICIAEMPDASVAPLPIPPAPLNGDITPIETAIDRNEPILSDVPNLIVET